MPRSSVLRVGRPHHDVRTNACARICSGVSLRMRRPAVVTRSIAATAVVARLLAQDVAHERQVLDGVAVGVDDRMVDARADLGRRS